MTRFGQGGGELRARADSEQRPAPIKLAKQAGFSLREVERFVRGFDPVSRDERH